MGFVDDSENNLVIASARIENSLNVYLRPSWTICINPILTERRSASLPDTLFH